MDKQRSGVNRLTLVSSLNYGSIYALNRVCESAEIRENKMMPWETVMQELKQCHAHGGQELGTSHVG